MPARRGEGVPLQLGEKAEGRDDEGIDPAQPAVATHGAGSDLGGGGLEIGDLLHQPPFVGAAQRGLHGQGCDQHVLGQAASRARNSSTDERGVHKAVTNVTTSTPISVHSTRARARAGP